MRSSRTWPRTLSTVSNGPTRARSRLPVRYRQEKDLMPQEDRALSTARRGRWIKQAKKRKGHHHDGELLADGIGGATARGFPGYTRDGLDAPARRGGIYIPATLPRMLEALMKDIASQGAV
jgi:hypothetical protein